MYFQVVSITHSLERPQEELGDATLSPVFRRVSARCPVLHLFGYVHIPLVEASLPPATASSLGAATQTALHEPATTTATAAGLTAHEGEGRRSRLSRAGEKVDEEEAEDRCLSGDAAPLATLLEPGSNTASLNTAPSPGHHFTPLPSPALASAQRRADRASAPSPSPRLTARAVHVVEPPEDHEAPNRSAEACPVHHVHHRVDGVKSTSFSKDTLRSSTVLRSRYTQRRACLHVHGVYPTLLLPQYDRNISAEQLAAQLETVAVRALARQGFVVPSQQLVHNVRLVHRYNVYGYRPHAYAFYQVELIDPNMHGKVVDILQNTREVGGRQWQLYDAHMKYHTQFMVHWRINGVAPFPLPVPRCHVRLPTSVELRAPSSQHTSEDAAVREGNFSVPYHDKPPTSPTQQPNRKTGRDAAKETNDSTHTGSKNSSSSSSGEVSTSSYTGPSFLRFWRSDELGRLTTAEVEMDVCAHDLSEPATDGASSIENGDEEKTNLKGVNEAEGNTNVGSNEPERAVARSGNSGRAKVSAGDNLSYTRRIIRQYFKEHGVPDALRVADTIAMERHLQAKAAMAAHAGAGGGEEHNSLNTHAGLLQSLLRYGSVTQIQRADPTVRWMRHRMLDYLEQRRAALRPAMLDSSENSEASAPNANSQRRGDSSVQAEDAAVSELKVTEDTAGQGPSAAASISHSTVSLDPMTIPFGAAAARTVPTAAQQQEQRAIRARMVAEYSKPGGGHRHSRFARHSTVQTFSEGSVVVPALLPTYAELGAGAVLAMGGTVSNPSGYAAAAGPANAGSGLNNNSDAFYIGFSSDSLQLTPSQEAPTQDSTRAKDEEHNLSSALKGENVDLSQSWMRDVPLVMRQEVEVTSTQDLMAALLARTSASFEALKSTTEPEMTSQEQLAKKSPNQSVQQEEEAPRKILEEEEDGVEGAHTPLLFSSQADEPERPPPQTLEVLKSAEAGAAPEDLTTAVPLTTVTQPAAKREAGTLTASSWSSWSSWSSSSSSSSTVTSVSPVTAKRRGRPSARRGGKGRKESKKKPKRGTKNTAAKKSRSAVSSVVLAEQAPATSEGCATKLTSPAEAQHMQEDCPTQSLEERTCPSSHSVADARDEQSTASALPLTRLPSPRDTAVETGCTPHFSSSTDEEKSDPYQSDRDSLKREESDAEITRKLLRFAPVGRESCGQDTTTAATTVTSSLLTVGDCVAFVRVHRPSTSTADVSMARRSATQLCEVLAMARVARLDATSADLQWLLALSETHLASDEAALVRRGAWVRLTRDTSLPTKSHDNMTAAGTRAANAPVLLGEMFVGDTVDTVPLSVLQGLAPSVDVVRARTRTAPTQQLPPEYFLKSGTAIKDEPAQLSLEADALKVVGGTSDDEPADAVQVWPVVCCTRLRTYESTSSVVAPPLYSAALFAHDNSVKESLSCPCPVLCVLCRYQYVIAARVLTAVPESFFTKRECANSDWHNTTLSRRSRASSEDQDEAALVATQALPKHGGSLEYIGQERLLTRSPRHSSVHRASSRVLFTQPEVFDNCRGGDEMSGEDDVADCQSSLSNTRPFLIDAVGNVATHAPTPCGKVEIDEKSAPQQGLPISEFTSAESDTEDAVLFPSSSSDDSIQHAGGEALLSDTKVITRPSPFELPESFASFTYSLHAKQNSGCETLRPDLLGEYSPAKDVTSASERPLYHITTRCMPVDTFIVGDVHVHRGVLSATRQAAEQLESQEQLRWRRHSATLGETDEGGVRRRWSNEVLGHASSSPHKDGQLVDEEKDSAAQGRRRSTHESGDAPQREHGDTSASSSIEEGLPSARSDKELLLSPRAADDAVVVDALSQLSLPAHYSVRDSTELRAHTLSSLSSAVTASPDEVEVAVPSMEAAATASQASSVEAMGLVTASQRGFLELFRDAVRRATNSGSAHDVQNREGFVLQQGGTLARLTDGIPRCFRVSARNALSTGESEAAMGVTGEGGEAARRCGAQKAAAVRMQVSAVTWPYVEPPTLTQSPAEHAGFTTEPPRFERINASTSGIDNASGEQAGLAGRKRETKAREAVPSPKSALPTARNASRDRRSASHVPGLSLSVTQQPQHYLQCVLRVQYIEVLLNRRPGEALVSTSEVLAVGLGQATTSANSGIGIRIFCVAPPSLPSSSHDKQQPSSASKGEDSAVARDEEAGDAASSTGVGVQGTATAATAAPLSLPGLHLHGLCSPVQVVTVADEAALLARVRDEILAYDPDMLLSWEGYKYGLGYLALRYRAVLQRSLSADLSRTLLHHSYQPKSKAPYPSSRTDAAIKTTAATPATTATTTPLADVGSVGVQEGGQQQQHDLHDAQGSTGKGGYISESVSAVPARVGDSTVDQVGRPITSQGEPINAHNIPSSASSASSGVLDDFEPIPYGDDIEDDDEDFNAEGVESDGQGSERGAAARANGWRGRGRGGWRPPQPQQQLQQHQQTPSRSGKGQSVWWQRFAPSATTATTKTSKFGAGATGESADAVAAYSKRFGANVQVTGRICTSLGKDLRKDVKMPSYALPMVHAELFGQPLPYFTDTYLADLYHAREDPGEREAALRYLAARVAAPHRIACTLHWFTKLLEFSRMYGILTEEVLTRGSQFRVEATLLRLAHPLKYAMLSPSMLQVHRQPRIECIPLVMQPKADFYRREDPVVVLDFRSLYPSIIIAYNLCYTTCLGMVQPTAQGRLGVLTNFTQRDSLLAELLPDDGVQHDSVVFTPNGAMFVAPSTRVGLVPQMVQAVLDTRFEVQASLRHIAVPTADDTMQQRLQEQQLALKMLANVTYGYTAASFTGRMPCVDLAEAIVSLGRQTLERAVALIHSTAAWRAEVVYGDTDSLFVRLHGRSLAEAFEIGQQMADAVTQSNPSPIRLQFEKVLSPCLLLVKKRYAGYMWTSPSQTTPTFLAKGIEVVRRDQCPATVQLVKQMLKLLFDGNTAATLKHVYYSTVEKMQAGAVNPLLCIFRRAVKLGRYGHNGDGHLPLAARLALKQMEKDVTETPYWGELLPYVVVRSTHSIDNLTDQVLHPAHLLYLEDKHTLDASYYVTRNINSSLDRMFYLVGISFAQWYQAMPRRRTAHAALLNLPTFMKAQEQLGKTGKNGSRPPSAVPPAPPPTAFAPFSGASKKFNSMHTRGHGRQNTLDAGLEASEDDAAARVDRVARLTAHMQQLLRESTDPLLAARRDARLMAAATEVISDDNDSSISEEDDASCDGSFPQQRQRRRKRRRGEGVDGGEGQRGGAPWPSSTPVDVEDLTRPTVHECVDVEQLMATQRARLSQAGAGAAWTQQQQQQQHEQKSAKGQLQLLPRRPVIRRRRGGRAEVERNGITLDTFYPRTLCVVCEKEAVSLDDVRHQREVFHLLNPSALRSNTTRAAGESRETETTSEGRSGTAQLPHTAASAAPSVLLLPPICTRCWSDPFTLHLQVQERCRSFGQQLDSLQQICASCVGSGGDWGPRAQSMYKSAIQDMEDMDAFAAARTHFTRAEDENRVPSPHLTSSSNPHSSTSTAASPAGLATSTYAVGSVPRHMLTAVQLSSRGVPQGCVSIDCAVGFEKKWVTEQWQQWQAVQRFLRSVL